MKPARQLRLAALLAAAFLGGASASALPAPQGRQGRHRPPAAAPHVDKKKEAQKRPPLHVETVWKTSLPSSPGAVPAYDAARVYVPMRSGQFAAIALQDGKVVWTIDLSKAEPPASKKPAVNPPAVSPPAVNPPAVNPPAVSPPEPEKRAEVQQPPADAQPAEAVQWAGPAAGDDLVFVATLTRIEAHDAATGEARWQTTLDAPLVSPLLWQNGWLFLSMDGGKALMLRAATGDRLWERTFPANVRQGVAMTGDRIYLPLENGKVVAAVLQTGASIWERQLAGRPAAISPLDDRIFVGADDKYFYCLSAKNGKPKWRWRTGGTIVGLPAIDEKNVYFLALDNVLRALARGDGHQAWQAGVPMRPSSGPFLTGRLLVVAGVSPDIRAYQVIDGSEAGTAEMPGDLVAPPHFLALRGDEVSPFVVITGEGLLVRFVPTEPPLPSKAFPAKPVYPLLPEVGGAAPIPREE